mmetsp:Transcript_28194/g.65837  ORF Transcript_28194/g.65837 Transcript_28194/m.65837 type:complete len:376 (-) Transcript_28194:559-1686(-)
MLVRDDGGGFRAEGVGGVDDLIDRRENDGARPVVIVGLGGIRQVVPLDGTAVEEQVPCRDVGLHEGGRAEGGRGEDVLQGEEGRATEHTEGHGGGLIERRGRNALKGVNAEPALGGGEAKLDEGVVVCLTRDDTLTPGVLLEGLPDHPVDLARNRLRGLGEEAAEGVAERVVGAQAHDVEVDQAVIEVRHTCKLVCNGCLLALQELVDVVSGSDGEAQHLDAPPLSDPGDGCLPRALAPIGVVGVHLGGCGRSVECGDVEGGVCGVEGEADLEQGLLEGLGGAQDGVGRSGEGDVVGVEGSHDVGEVRHDRSNNGVEGDAEKEGALDVPLLDAGGAEDSTQAAIGLNHGKARGAAVVGTDTGQVCAVDPGEGGGG